MRNQTSLDAKVPDSAEEWKSEMALRWTISQIGIDWAESEGYFLSEGQEGGD